MTINGYQWLMVNDDDDDDDDDDEDLPTYTILHI